MGTHLFAHARTQLFESFLRLFVVCEARAEPEHVSVCYDEVVTHWGRAPEPSSSWTRSRSTGPGTCEQQNGTVGRPRGRKARDGHLCDPDADERLHVVRHGAQRELAMLDHLRGVGRD